MTTPFVLPANLLPTERHFGCGPTAIRKDAIVKLGSSSLLGTSHRQSPVKDLVGQIRANLTDLLDIPTGWEVVLGNGGATAMWAINAACLIEKRAATAVCGAFSAKCAGEIDRAPHLEAAQRSVAAPGGFTPCAPDPQADAYCWTHNETSTGVRAPLGRIPGAREDALTLIDATSIAGAAAVDWQACDSYYFSPQKAFAADGGLWLAVLSPAALERALRLAASSDRWVPGILDLSQAIANSRKNQTLNTPAIATLELLASQLDWLCSLGGIEAVEARCAASARVLHDWATRREEARLFVTDPALRSPVVTTIEFSPEVDATAVTGVLRANGIVDINPYRGVGDNQIRIGTFPTLEAADVEALTACLDYVLDRVSDAA